MAFRFAKIFFHKHINSVYGTYSSSSEHNPTSHTLLCRSSSQKVAKIKEKEKLMEMFTPKIKFNILKDNFQKTFELMSEFANDYACIKGEQN